MVNQVFDDHAVADVTKTQANQLLKLQRDILEKIALGKEQDYQLILDQLCQSTESLINDAVASIMIFDDNCYSLHIAAAPSLSETAISSLNGLVPGECAGSCGTCVYSGKPQFVFNTHSDYRWQGLQQFAIDFSVGACWSMPIKISDDEVIGSFALSSFEERKPSNFHRHLLETATYIASVVFKRQQEQKKLWEMGHYDALTGLPNRVLLMLRLQHAIEKTKRNKQKVAVLFLDLDDFKIINDTQGHEVGDNVLKSVSTAIAECLRPGDTLARLGGDEFVVVVDSFKDNSNLTGICKKILTAVKKGNQFDNLAISTSIGVSVYPDHGSDIGVLLRNADTAMYRAKELGTSKFYFYQQELTEVAQHKLSLSKAMSLALLQNRFIIHYQPQVSQTGGKVLGLEALVRWNHPEKGLIPPDQFISIAEENGFIREIGLYVLQRACEQCLAWWASGLPEFVLTVNVSVKQLKQGIAERIEYLLKNLNYPISLLELEITESVVMEKADLTELRKLNALGISISMDDFGTGYSSLAQLKCLPINKLKIDRSFVKDIPHSQDDIMIVRAIIAMAKNLGLKIVAEGVENEAQFRFFADEECDSFQGYFLSKPVPPEQTAELLKNMTINNL